MSRKQRLTGWIFDAYPDDGGMRVWIITPEGRSLHFLDEWSPRFFVGGDFDRVLPYLGKQPFPLIVTKKEKIELFSGRTKSVLEVQVPIREYFSLAKELQDLRVPLYDGDVH